MRNSTRFSAKFADSIVATLHCVDRLIFKGYLPLGDDQQLNQFVDRLGIRRKDFLPQLEPFSVRLVEHAKSAAEQADAPYHDLQGQHSKEKLIDQTIRQRKLAFTHRPQRVLDYYHSRTQRACHDVRI